MYAILCYCYATHIFISQRVKKKTLQWDFRPYNASVFRNTFAQLIFVLWEGLQFSLLVYLVVCQKAVSEKSRKDSGLQFHAALIQRVLWTSDPEITEILQIFSNEPIHHAEQRSSRH